MPPMSKRWAVGSSEFEQAPLEALGVAGRSIGPSVDSVVALGNVEPDDHPDSIEFVRAALHEIRRLTDGTDLPKGAPEGAVSTVPSTVRRGTARYSA